MVGMMMMMMMMMMMARSLLMYWEPYGMTRVGAPGKSGGPNLEWKRR